MSIRTRQKNRNYVLGAYGMIMSMIPNGSSNYFKFWIKVFKPAPGEDLPKLMLHIKLWPIFHGWLNIDKTFSPVHLAQMYLWSKFEDYIHVDNLKLSSELKAAMHTGSWPIFHRYVNKRETYLPTVYSLVSK